MAFSKDIFLDDKQNSGKTTTEEFQAQRNINARLGGMGVRNVTGTQYDNMSHRANVLYVVTRNSNTVELYKGDTLISGTGKVVINDAVVFSTDYFDGGGMYWLDSNAHEGVDTRLGGDIDSSYFPSNIVGRYGGIVTRFIFSDPHDYGDDGTLQFSGGLCTLFIDTKGPFDYATERPDGNQTERATTDYYYDILPSSLIVANELGQLRPYLRLYVERYEDGTWVGETITYQAQTATGMMLNGPASSSSNDSYGTSFVKVTRTVNGGSTTAIYYPHPDLFPIPYGLTKYGTDTTFTNGTISSIPRASRSGGGGLSLATTAISNGRFTPFLVLNNYILRETSENFCRLGLMRDLSTGDTLTEPKVKFATTGNSIMYELDVAKIMSTTKENPL